MGISKSKTNTKSTSTSTPLDQYAPYITQGLTTAQGVLNDNQSNMQNLSGKALDVANGFGAQQSTLANIYGGNTQAAGTFSNLQHAGANDSSIPTLTQLAQGSTNPAQAIFQQMTNGQANGDTSQYYKDVIGGKFLDNNPYIDAIAQHGMDAATKGLNQRFAASGMGEGMGTPYASALGTAVGDANNSLRYQNYSDERGRQNTVAGLSDSQYNATKDRNLAAAGGLSSTYAGDRSAQLAAAQALGGQNNANNQTALNGANGSLQSIMSALGLSGQMSQEQLNALQVAAGIPYTGVNAYSGIVNGLTGKYGNVDQTGVSKTSGNLGQMLAQMGGQAAQAFAMGG
jgi:hypothetical protein